MGKARPRRPTRPRAATAPLVFALPGNERFAVALAAAVHAEEGRCEVRRFPDGESYVRVDASCRGRACVVVATLDRPDAKVLPLYLLARTLRDLSARSVLLAAPYLPYLRQDRAFRAGEAESARQFAALVSAFVDGVVTVEPHLHRIHALADVYSVPARAVSAAAPIARWIEGHVKRPLVVGPDAESAAWVSAVAKEAGAPHVVLEKVRRGDRDVEVALGDVRGLEDLVPVLVDDCASTGRTLAAARRALSSAGLAPGPCVAVHAVMADGAQDALRAAGIDVFVTTNTIPHPSNAIDVVPVVAASLRAGVGTADPRGRPAHARRRHFDPGTN